MSDKFRLWNSFSLVFFSILFFLRALETFSLSELLVSDASYSLSLSFFFFLNLVGIFIVRFSFLLIGLRGFDFDEDFLDFSEEIFGEKTEET